MLSSVHPSEMHTENVVVDPPGSNCLELLVSRFVAQSPRSDALCCIHAGERSSHRLSYVDLWDMAQRCRRRFRELGLERGQVVALAIPSSEHLLAILLAAWSEGLGISLLPHDISPRTGRMATTKFAAMLTLVAPHFLIVHEDALAHMPIDLVAKRECVSDFIEAVKTCLPLSEKPQTASNDVAILQFTSGSSGFPKAVVITQAMLAMNCAAIASRVAVRSGDRMVSWLPLHHDMGLSAITLAWWCGIDLVLIPTAAYARQPLVWLDTLSQFRGTLSPAPASAYALITRFAPALAKRNVDLSSWRYGWAGAEPVFDSHLRDFAAALAPYGLQANVVQPAYGMAEAVVAISLNPPGKPCSVCRLSRKALEADGKAVECSAHEPGALLYVSNGRTVDGVEARVVDNSGGALPERHIGALQIRGASVIHSYWGEPCAPTSSDGWFDTGDVGFLADGEIFISGRSKDLITRAGLNISPHHIEEIVEKELALRPGSVAVFSVLDAGRAQERIFALIARQPTSDIHVLRAKIARAVVDEAGVQLDEIQFVQNTDLPKTTSGKLQRSELRRIYAQIDTNFGLAPPTYLESRRV